MKWEAIVSRKLLFPAAFASIFSGKLEARAQFANDELAEPMSIGGAFSALPLFRKMNDVDWGLLFGKLVAWLRNNHAEMIMALHQDSLRPHTIVKTPKSLLVIAGILVLTMCGNARATLYNVSGGHNYWDATSGTLVADNTTVSGTLVTDTNFATISSVNLCDHDSAGGCNNINQITSWVSPVLNGYIYLNYPGGPDATQALTDWYISMVNTDYAYYDPLIASCTTTNCTTYYNGQLGVSLQNTQDRLSYQVLADATPVPEPTTLSLFAAALGALGLLMWRRQKKAPALRAT